MCKGKNKKKFYQNVINIATIGGKCRTIYPSECSFNDQLQHFRNRNFRSISILRRVLFLFYRIGH